MSNERWTKPFVMVTLPPRDWEGLVHDMILTHASIFAATFGGRAPRDSYTIAGATARVSYELEGKPARWEITDCEHYVRTEAGPIRTYGGFVNIMTQVVRALRDQVEVHADALEDQGRLEHANLWRQIVGAAP